jgi:hypothetical protein
MKVHVEIDCSPEEARRFMGLPDVEKANEIYVDALSNAMKGVSNVDQLQELTKHIAPMGQLGLKLFKDFMDSSAAFSASSQDESPKGKSKD